VVWQKKIENASSPKWCVASRVEIWTGVMSITRPSLVSNIKSRTKTLQIRCNCTSSEEAQEQDNKYSHHTNHTVYYETWVWTHLLVHILLGLMIVFFFTSLGLQTQPRRAKKDLRPFIQCEFSLHILPITFRRVLALVP
jgi:hypothetical protein